MSTPTLGTVLGYIHSEADDAAIDLFYDALKARRKILSAQRAAQVSVGATVTLSGISPKYLSGMRGTVTTVDRQRASVLLDAAATTLLRVRGARRFYVPPGVTEYEIHGVPLSTCVVTA